MNAAFHQVIGAKDDERLELFLASARRLGTAVQNVEKDFWVGWVLDVLFNAMAEGHPRLLFRGGTPLSKSFGLIDRYQRTSTSRSSATISANRHPSTISKR